MNADPKTVVSRIKANLHTIARNAKLLDETNFDKRAKAIDFIDFHIIDQIAVLQQMADTSRHTLGELKQQAETLKQQLEKTDAILFSRLRENIRSGVYCNISFIQAIRKYTAYIIDNSLPNKIGYDNLDVFVNGLLFNQPLPEATLEPAPEMVFYQQTPARIILELCQQAALCADDLFFDLGSGLGLVTIMVNLISQTKTRGIEYEPAYCNYAKACASGLNLPHVAFINMDAREADYTGGTVFFLYTPFEGSILQTVLAKLQKESQKRTIRIFTYGPCSAHVARQSWLSCANGPANNSYKLYAFASIPAIESPY